MSKVDKWDQGSSRKYESVIKTNRPMSTEEVYFIND